MQQQLRWGLHSLAIDVPEQNLVQARRGPAAPPLTDIRSAVRHALEEPYHYPALRRALTPDDHIAIAVDERLTRLPEVLVTLLEYLRTAGIAPKAITLLCGPPSTGQPWVDQLPDEFQDVAVEVHQPGERRKLSYLATTRQGRRVYLNRSAVDADQLILLTGRRYDPVFGISGAETALFPNLGDEATLQETGAELSLDAPDNDPWPIRKEAVEIAWLLGAPFLLQVIEGAGDEVLHVLGGPVESTAEGQRLLDARWRVEVDRAADVVVACIGGDPAGQTVADLAQAFASAARVVRPGGRIALLTDAQPAPGRSAELMRLNEDPGAFLNMLLEEKPTDLATGFLWASAAQQAKLYLLSRLPGEMVEELFATPLEHASQVQRLVGPSDLCLILPDAHKTMAVLKNP